MPGPQTQHKGTVYGDDENAPKPGLSPPMRRRPRDQVIRENPASRGTETSAEVLVGPP